MMITGDEYTLPASSESAAASRFINTAIGFGFIDRAIIVVPDGTFSILGDSQVLVFNSKAHARSARFHVLSSGQRFCMHRQLVLS